MRDDKLYRKFKRNMEMSGNGRLAVPGQVSVSTSYADGPLAQPSSIALQSSAGMQTIVFGGLTKVEQLAGQIAGSWTAQTNLLQVALRTGGTVENLNFNQGAVEDRIVDVSVTMAEKLLAECARRREAEKETP